MNIVQEETTNGHGHFYDLFHNLNGSDLFDPYVEPDGTPPTIQSIVQTFPIYVHTGPAIPLLQRLSVGANGYSVDDQQEGPGRTPGAGGGGSNTGGGQNPPGTDSGSGIYGGGSGGGTQFGGSQTTGSPQTGGGINVGGNGTPSSANDPGGQNVSDFSDDDPYGQSSTSN